MKVFAAQINPTIGALQENTDKILRSLSAAKKKGADVVVFPELTLTGYFPDDLLFDAVFIDETIKQLERIGPATEGLMIVVGLPRWNNACKEKLLYNSAAIFMNGKLVGYKNKTVLPTYDVFDEKRYFEPGNEEVVCEYLGYRIAITIGEDLYLHADGTGDIGCRKDSLLALQGKRPDFVLNLAAVPYAIHRKNVRFSLAEETGRNLRCPLIVCNQVGANDQLIFDGYSFYCNERGELLQVAKGFVEDELCVDVHCHACACSLPENGIHDLYSALVLGVRDYFHKQNLSTALIGLSGGIDSALVACIAKDALGAANVVALNLPSRYTPQQSIEDTRAVAECLQIALRVLPIDMLFQQFLDLLEPLFEKRPFDATEENVQARIRMMILMAFANKFHGVLLNTGNKSEIAMGYTTLYGDMAGGLGVLLDVTKSYVYQLAAYVNHIQEQIPQSIIEKVPSPELKEGQTDFDVMPDFAVLDAIIEDYIEERLSIEEIATKRCLVPGFVAKIIRKIHAAEYKRRQAPIGLRVTSKAFTKGRIVPIAQKWYYTNYHK